MTAEWHYSKDGQEHGPVSASDLKNLAKSGDLLPSDLIWKEGMAEWKPASNVKGLFASTPVPAAESPKASPSSPQIKVPPILPETAQKQSLVEAAKDAARGAAQYAAKQTERTKLMNLTLPPLYQALGRHAISSPAYRAEFAEVFQQLDQLQAELTEINGRTPVAAKSLGDKAKAMAGQAMQAAQAQKLSLRQSSLFGTLGKAVYDKHEGASGPHELVKPIAESVARLAMLDGDLNALSSSKDGSWITPKRMAISVGAAACVLLLIVMLMLRGGPALLATKDGGESPKTEITIPPIDFSKVTYSPVDFSSLDYSKGPNGEVLEEFYADGTTYRGYIPGNPPAPDDLKWRGLRQPVLRKASKDKSFVTHGIQTYWVKRPRFPTERVEENAKRDGKEPPSYSTDGGVRQKVWHVWEGKMHGSERLFDNSGTILMTEHVYVNGELHGPATSYWPNGKKQLQQFVIHGKLHGSKTQWYEGGQTAETSTFVDGIQEGVRTTFYVNGQKKEKATFVNGKVVGRVQEWDNKGNDVTVDISGTLATGNGYTDRMLSLHPNVLRKYSAFKYISKEKDKPRYKPGTVDDLLQAMSLLSSEKRLSGFPVENGNLFYGKYSSIYGNPTIPSVLWNQLLLSPTSEAVKEDYVDTLWTINCTDGTVRMFGMTDPNQAVRISTLWWDKYSKEFCVVK